MKPRLLSAVLSATVLFCATIHGAPLKCWILGTNTGETAFTPTDITNLVNEVNLVYQQVAMRFSIVSISTTNDTALADVDGSSQTQKRKICDLDANTGCIEIYFAHSLSGSSTAFHRPEGIIIGPAANSRTLAHELGHACGLPDIYLSHSGFSGSVDGPPTQERLPDDWGMYPPQTTQADIVRRLLMYGSRSNTKIAFSRGDIYGVFYTREADPSTQQTNRVWHLGLAPVGVWRHLNPNPFSR